jgi:hypothetical protein
MRNGTRRSPRGVDSPIDSLTVVWSCSERMQLAVLLVASPYTVDVQDRGGAARHYFSAVDLRDRGPSLHCSD